MSDTLLNLDEVEEIVTQDSKSTPKEVRIRFWRIVKRLKQTPNPDREEVRQAARIRNILFRENRGRTYPLWPPVAILTILGLLGPTYWYLSLLDNPLQWSAILVWTSADWWVFLRRLGSLLGAVFCFYPFGRIIGAKWAGIRIDGMSRGMYNEPTVKIDYESFLLATPSKRKWFFFFAGLWTIITALALGLVGLALVGDHCGTITALFLGISEGAAILSGTTHNVGGEMAHYNRERKIEKEWRRNLAE